MLTELIKTIESLRNRIRDHRPYFDGALAEVKTRVSLIDPLLLALGWDVGDPGSVKVEVTVKDGRPDYLLLRGNGEPLLILEAKKLADTGDHPHQIAKYVVGENLQRASKIPYGAITNGSRWRVFDMFTQNCVVDASVERDSATRCALKLLGLWQPALREGSAVESVTDLIQRTGGSSQQGEVGATSAPTPVAGPKATPSERPVGPSGSVAGWIPLDSETLRPSQSVRPSTIRFPDGSSSQVDSWTSMLVAIAQWLFDVGLLKYEEMPFVVAGTRYCVSADGRRPDGKALGRPLSVGETGLQIEGDFDAKQIRRFAVDLLERYDRSSSQVELMLLR